MPTPAWHNLSGVTSAQGNNCQLKKIWVKRESSPAAISPRQTARKKADSKPPSSAHIALLVALK